MARLLHSYPSLARQFTAAEAVRPLVRTGRLQRRLTQAAGRLGIVALRGGFSRPLAQPWDRSNSLCSGAVGPSFGGGLAQSKARSRLVEYGKAVLRELIWVDEITAACFGCFDRFQVLATVTMLYFTAAIYGEERERTGQAGSDDAFLLADHAAYRALAAAVFEEAAIVPAAAADRFAAKVRHAIEPYNLGNLCDPKRRNMYTCVCN